jgi:hypothetical protein
MVVREKKVVQHKMELGAISVAGKVSEVFLIGIFLTQQVLLVRMPNKKRYLTKTFSI